MRLSELINGDGVVSEVDILGLSSDSREIQPGYLFAALAGAQADGADFIRDAIRHGAVAVLARPDVATICSDAAGGEDIQVVADNNPRRRLALMAAKFYPHQPDTVVAVTGTNGKTSVVSFVRQIWEQLDYRAASLGTIGIEGAKLGVGFSQRLERTTPEPVELHTLIDRMAAEGIDHLAMEASSHGLDQFRLDGVRVAAAAFTNLTRDHMDYHADPDDYLYAKMRLFGEVMAPGGVAVLNADDPHFTDFEDICWARGHRIVTVGTGESDLRLVDRQSSNDGQLLKILWQGAETQVTLPLISDFQAINALMAAALAIATGSAPAQVFMALGRLKGPRGRIELVAHHPSGAPVFVDYAHTPDALRNLLQALRPYAANRLSVVFGCGGDRDRGKRAQMGQIAAAMADQIVVTDDNPRNEDPANIRAEIMSAVPNATNIADRSEAIRFAISGLRSGDLMVVAGKGHESGQIAGDVVSPFDDAQEVREAVAKLEEGRKDG